VGKLTNGDIFDQIPKPGTPGPISFNLQGVIKGWTNGVPELREGGRITLYIPPSLGYGTRAVGSIPANSILVFDITLVNVQ
jgi:FKBP-type peptidyl-prolyl cis-trans isomerase FkpA